MLRRRAAEPSPPPAATEQAALERLAEAGWLLPRALVAPTGPAARWTWIGTLDSPTTTAVDGGGAVCRDGWSLDWWVGADDRWHLPAREPNVRQRLIGGAPVVETRMRIPGGDAVHRAYGIRGAGGAEHVVVEIENGSTIPFVVALAVRPFDPTGRGLVEDVTIEPTGGGQGRDVAQLVRVGGRPALLLPASPPTRRLARGLRATWWTR